MKKEYFYFSLNIIAWSASIFVVILGGSLETAITYQISIYSNFNWFFWILFCISTLLHTICSVRSTQVKNSLALKIDAVSGILGILVNVSTLILLPTFLNYPILRSDLGLHLYDSREILLSNNITNNQYPALFVLIHIIHVMTNVDLSKLWLSGSMIGYFFYVGFAFLIGNRLFNRWHYGAWLALLASVPAAGEYINPIYPASVSVQFLLFLIYLYVLSRQKKEIGYNILLLLLAFLFPFIHPLTAVMAIFWLSIIEVSRSLIIDKRYTSIKKARLYPSFILGITWFIWYSSTGLLNKNFRMTNRWISGEATTQLTNINTLAEKTGFSISQILLQVIKEQNGLIFFVVAGTLSSIFLFIFSFKRHVLIKEANLVGSIIISLIFSGLIVFIGLVGPFGELDFYRFARFLMPWATIGLISLVILSDYQNWSRKIFISLMSISISSLIIAGAFVIHPSPYIIRPNDQITRQELRCIEWLYENTDGRSIYGILGARNLASLALGRETAWSIPGIYYQFPDHLGYDQFQQVKENFVHPFYLLVTVRDKVVYGTLWTSVNRFSPQDFQKLYDDPSVNLIYKNGQCEIWATK